MCPLVTQTPTTTSSDLMRTAAVGTPKPVTANAAWRPPELSVVVTFLGVIRAAKINLMDENCVLVIHFKLSVHHGRWHQRGWHSHHGVQKAEKRLRSRDLLTSSRHAPSDLLPPVKHDLPNITTSWGPRIQNTSLWGGHFTFKPQHSTPVPKGS